MADIVFKRTGKINVNGSIPGEMTIGKKTWPTIERGMNYTFVRKGEYELLMTEKLSGRKVKCLCFHEDRAISSHLIHDALNDNHHNLSGCIAPGLTSDGTGIKNSDAAMVQIWAALGGYKVYGKCTIKIENNIQGSETKERWIARRKKTRESDSDGTR